MKFSKEVTINLGNYENVKLGVSECDSFEQANEQLKIEMNKINQWSKAVK